jgi:hypothetical protein
LLGLQLVQGLGEGLVWSWAFVLAVVGSARPLQLLSAPVEALLAQVLKPQSLQIQRFAGSPVAPHRATRTEVVLE